MSFLNKYTNTTTTDTTTTRAPLPSVSKRKISIHFGLNDYRGEGNDLKGCVNDAREWQNLLSSNYGFKTQIFEDSKCTSDIFLNKIGTAIAESKSADHIVVTYSGHGSNVADKNGDEPDGRDEALCLYDRFLIDDELRAIFKSIHPEARFTFISDSCHSGTVTRAFISTMSMDKAPIPRYLPPLDEVEATLALSARVTSRILYPEEGMNEILISGCLPTEYSYDAKLGGKYMGAMSYHAINILKASPNLTYDEFYTALRLQLPSGRYPQTPQLEGRSGYRSERMFI